MGLTHVLWKRRAFWCNRIIANICFQNSQYAADKISNLEHFNLNYDNRSFIKEFVVKTAFSAKKLVNDAAKAGYSFSKVLGDSSDSLILLAFTEKYNKNHIDAFVEYLKDYSQS